MPVIIHSGMNEIMIRYRAPTKVICQNLIDMIGVRLPGRIPGMNPPYFRMLSATSLGLKTMET